MFQRKYGLIQDLLRFGCEEYVHESTLWRKSRGEMGGPDRGLHVARATNGLFDKTHLYKSYNNYNSVHNFGFRMIIQHQLKVEKGN